MTKLLRTDASHQCLFLFLMTLAFDGSESFTSFPSKAFQCAGTQISQRRNRPSSMSMDLEIENQSLGKQIPISLDSIVNHPYIEPLLHKDGHNFDIESAEQTHGMPWKTSIVPDAPLLYMRFWEWQLSFMKDNLTNLRVLDCTSEGSASFTSSHNDFSFNENIKKQARIVNLNFASDEYRKIRLTYYDAGEGCQVFNSVWYPHDEKNLPILGIDLLAFNRKKFLAIVDFQPLYQKEELHSVTYEESILEPIREDYPSLKGKMSSKFYDETQFFSRQMLFSRFEEERVILDELYPAFERYVQSHVEMVKSTEPNPENIKIVAERQAAYDSYSAERDPATGLFTAMFGKAWADEYVHGFLFSKSDKSESSIPPSHSQGGGPPVPPATQGQRQS